MFLWFVAWIAWLEYYFLLYCLPSNMKLPKILSLFYDLLLWGLQIITRMSQVQRLLLIDGLQIHRGGIDQPSSALTLVIRKSLDYNRFPFASLNEEDLVEKILRQMNIKTGRAILKIAVHKILELENYKKHINVFRESRFEKENKEHMKLLCTLWKRLKGTETVPTIPGSEWVSIGFQGRDPSTDFRGMGLLGLDQLKRFVDSNRAIASDIFEQVSSEESNLWMPFAITGINITSFQYQLLMSGRLDKLLYDAPVLMATAYDKVYANIFAALVQHWTDSNPRDIMDFPRIYGEVKTRLLKQYR